MHRGVQLRRLGDLYLVRFDPIQGGLDISLHVLGHMRQKLEKHCLVVAVQVSCAAGLSTSALGTARASAPWSGACALAQS